MYKIVDKKILNPTVIQLMIEAPLVARKAKPGQFIILRVDEDGERIPLTVAGTTPENGTVKIIFQFGHNDVSLYFVMVGIQSCSGILTHSGDWAALMTGISSSASLSW